MILLNNPSATSLCFGAMTYLSSDLAFQFPREKRFSILMRSFGMNSYMYWFAKLIFDFTFVAGWATVLGPIYYTLNYPGFDNLESLMALTSLILCWGMNIISIIYLLSFFSLFVRNVRTTFFYVWMLGLVLGEQDKKKRRGGELASISDVSNCFPTRPNPLDYIVATH